MPSRKAYKRKAYSLAVAAMAALLAGCAVPSSRTAIVVPQAAPVATLPPAAAGVDARGPVFAPGAINPAVTQQNIAATICAPHWTATIRPPSPYTNRLKLEQMRLYGFPAGTDPRSLREDHREPLQLGGAPRDPQNLWPQPRTEARAKDRLESAVKRDVCAGRLSLQQAQAIFFGDFWRDYDRRFGSR